MVQVRNNEDLSKECVTEDKRWCGDKKCKFGDWRNGMELRMKQTDISSQ